MAVVDVRQQSVTIEYVDPRTLQPHPYNVTIYGDDEPTDDLEQKIAASKWIKPLIATQGNKVIAGHRRRRVSIKLGFKLVPVERRIFTNEIEELEALLLENATREKTSLQKIQEGKTWEYIASKKSIATQHAQGDIGREHGKEGGRPSKQTNANSTDREKPLVDARPQGVSPQPPNVSDKRSNNQKKERGPATRDNVAAQVGLGSGKTYERGKKASDTADELEKRGYIKEARALRDVINTQKMGGVEGASKVAAMPEEKQLAILRKIAAGEATTVKGAELLIKKEEIDAQAQAAPTKPRIILASWDTWLPRQDLCDLLISDPPYSTDIADIDTFAQTWLPVALSKVKPTGRAYICIGAYPCELRAYLNVQTSIPIQQILVWSYRNTMGPSPTHDYKLNWQAILYFRGPEAPPLNQDAITLNEQFSAQEINAPDGRQGNRYHTWQKPDELAAQLIRHSTKPGDTVIDCFAGTGTFLLTAHRLGRVASGCDYSPAMLDIARTRGCEVISEK